MTNNKPLLTEHPLDIVTIDFETYYDKEYSLRKMSTEEYIRDPRFEVIGVCVKLNDGKATWYSGDDVAGFLHTIDYSDKAILAHNAAFDGAILSWRYGIKPKMWLDTMSMARPGHALTTGVSLDALSQYYNIGTKGGAVRAMVGKRRADFTTQELEVYANYCVNDTELTYQLFHKLMSEITRSELVIIDSTIRMFTEPTFVLDKAALAEHLVDIREEKQRLLNQVLSYGNCTKDELMSNPKLATLLSSCGVNPPTKTNAKGNTTWAFAKTDPEFKGLLRHSDPRVRAIVEARLGVKSTLEETRTEAFIRIADRGTLPVQLNYWGAHTGRYSGAGGINLQNLTRKSKLRSSICAPPGYVVLAGDSSQIEARIVAWLAKQTDLLEAFRLQRDVYSEFASKIYGKPVEEITKEERFVGKTCILGLGYGMGFEKLKRTLAIGLGGVSVNIDTGEAARIVNLYRTVNNKIRNLWHDCGAALRRMVGTGKGTLLEHAGIGYAHDKIHLPSGMYIKYPGLRVGPHLSLEYDNRKVVTKIYGGKVTENITQALAQAVIKEQMLRLKYECGINTALQVHDEIVCVVPKERAEWAKGEMKRIMSQPPAWAPDLPVACEVGYGPNYGEAK